MTQNLTEFFREKKQRSDAENAGIDWSKRKSEWLHAVDSLYALIELILKEPLSQGNAKSCRRKKEITEEHLGRYEADELVLTVGDENVLFSPKGRNVIGAIGRVDVQGEAGEATLVLQSGPRWSLVQSKYPQLKLVELNEVSLGETLRGVMRQ